MTRSRAASAALAVTAAFSLLSTATASTYTFATSPHELNGDKHPVWVSATFSITDGEIIVTATNLENDPRADNQTLTAISFQLDAGVLSAANATLVQRSSENRSIDIGRRGVITRGPDPFAPTWGLQIATAGTGRQLTLSTLITNGGRQSLIGGPDPRSGTYADGNGSIVNNHDPWLFETAVFRIQTSNSSAIRSYMTISHVEFYFGTNGKDVFTAHEFSSTPEPATAALAAAGLLLAVRARRKTSRKLCRQGGV